MVTVGTEIILILALIAANGVLAMSELAIVSARRARLQHRAESGDTGARTALALANEPSRFLSTVQIGITSVGILTGAFGGATLAESLSDRLSTVPALDPYSDAIGIVVVVVAITYLSLIVGELVPKRLALQFPERIAARVARPMRILSMVAAPAVAVLSFSSDLALRLLGVRPSADPAVTEEEIRLVIEQGTQAGVIEEAEQDLVVSIFRLGDRKVGELMTPRPQIVYVDVDDPPDVSLQTMAESPHAYFPLCQGNLDNLLGVVSVRDLWARDLTSPVTNLRDLLRLPLVVQDTMPMLRAMDRIRETGSHMAVVVDEFGGVQGLFTRNDVLEAIIGDLPLTGTTTETASARREDGSWLLDGMTPAHELRDLLAVETLPGDREAEFQSLGGFVMAQLGRVPAVDDLFEWNNLRFEVMAMDGNRVHAVLVSPVAAGTDSTATARRRRRLEGDEARLARPGLGDAAPAAHCREHVRQVAVVAKVEPCRCDQSGGAKPGPSIRSDPD